MKSSKTMNEQFSDVIEMQKRVGYTFIAAAVIALIPAAVVTMMIAQSWGIVIGLLAWVVLTGMFGGIASLIIVGNHL